MKPWFADAVALTWRLLQGFGVRLYGSTSGYLGFKPPAICDNASYTLPATAPSVNGQSLVSTIGGTTSWASISTAVTNAGENYLTTAGSVVIAHPVDLSGSNVTGTLDYSHVPAPTLTHIGGVKATAGTVHQWMYGIDTSGNPLTSQPSFADISGTVAASQLPAPSATTLGGIQSILAVSHQWIDSISTSGVPHLSQPTLADISGVGTLASLNAAPAGTLTGTVLNATVVTSSLTSVGILTSLSVTGALNAASGITLGATGSTIQQGSTVDIVAIRDGTTAQELQITGTYTDSTHYERFVIRTAAGTHTIGSEKGSGGGIARAINVVSGGLIVATFGTDQSLTVNRSFSASGTFFVNVATNNSQLYGTAVLGWVAGTDVTATIDSGVARNAAGVVEANTGTKGTLGQFRAAAFSLGGLTGATAASRIVGATASGAPATGTFLLGDVCYTQNAHMYICTVAGSPGTWTLVA